MSLYAALYSGTSGLAANSSALGIISDNITNVNTVGYKAANAEFMTLVTESSTYGTYSPGGVQARARSLIGAQGLLQSSTSATDLAIDGNGFFVVKPEMGGKDVAFTRAGSFRPDERGYLQNTAGMYLMGWPLDAAGKYVDNGDVNVLSPINIAALTGTAEATTTAKVRANLMSSEVDHPTMGVAGYTAGALANGDIAAHYSRTVSITDTDGVSHDVTVSYLKTGDNQWAVEMHGDNLTPSLVSGTVVYNANGSVTSTVPPSVQLTWPGNTTPTQYDFNFAAGAADFPVPPVPIYSAGAMAGGSIEAHFSKTVKVYDSQGSAHNITMSFLKTQNTNEWALEIHGDPADITNGIPRGVVAAGRVTFNEDGSLNMARSSPALFEPVTFDWANGAADSNITFNFGTDGMADGLTQFDSASTMISSSMDGAVFGNVTGVSVGKDGVVTALFDNGLTRAVYKLPIATFQNPEGLMSVQGNSFAMTDFSGAFELVSSGTGGAGAVAPSTLEASTVDLAEEFTKLITTQRAYSASARIITTADEMLTELNQLKR